MRGKTSCPVSSETNRALIACHPDSRKLPVRLGPIDLTSTVSTNRSSLCDQGRWVRSFAYAQDDNRECHLGFDWARPAPSVVTSRRDTLLRVLDARKCVPSQQQPLFETGDLEDRRPRSEPDLRVAGSLTSLLLTPIAAASTSSWQSARLPAHSPDSTSL